jgi:flavorubredoxin
METTVHEIADGVYRLSTHVLDIPPRGFTFNQYLIDADEPLLFHTGPRALFPLVSAAIASVIPVERLRRITFGHLESDESGAMNLFLAAAPDAVVAHTALGCAVSVNDLADRAPEALLPDQVIDIGGKRVRTIATPHVPHGWDAHVLYEETTGTLFCGDLFTQVGDGPPLVHDADILTPALEAEDVFGATCLTAATAPTIRRLADLAPRTLALMHGPAFAGDAAGALSSLADSYATRFDASAAAVVGSAATR